MSEMIERVAHAMGDLADRRAAAEGCDEIGVMDADFLLDLAAEAIAAMREPTQAMLDAVCSDDPNAIMSATDTCVRSAWREMIDAALNSDAKQI